MYVPTCMYIQQGTDKDVFTGEGGVGLEKGIIYCVGERRVQVLLSVTLL